MKLWVFALFSIVIAKQCSTICKSYSDDDLCSKHCAAFKNTHVHRKIAKESDCWKLISEGSGSYLSTLSEFQRCWRNHMYGFLDEAPGAKSEL